MLLVTPSHAKLVEEGNRFVPNLLRQTHGDIERGHSIDVLIAIVDRIPEPADYKLTYAKKQGKHAGFKGGYTGNGISALLLDSENAAPDLWSDRPGSVEEVASTSQRQSKLSFHFHAIEERTDVVEGPHEERPHSSTSIKLPVANTLFYNGRESTIQAERWIAGETILESTLACIKRRPLKEQGLKLNAPPPGKGRFSPFRPIVPLSRITDAQTVAAAMGNIIRQFYVHDSSEEVEPASKRLENAVAHLLSKQGIGKRTVDIWAQVVPDPGQTRLAYLDDRILTGSRLHKVLSGGGGWGNRQGLLALDPERDFDSTPELSPFEGLEGEDAETEKRRGLSEIVSPGYLVNFWVESSAMLPPEKRFTEPLDGSWEVFPNCTSFVFGTMPSTDDPTPTSDQTVTIESARQHCIYVPDHFGMLSEKGMSFGIASPDGQSTQTKIDVPHSEILCGSVRGLPRIKRLQFTEEVAQPKIRIRKFATDNILTKSKAQSPKRKKVVNGNSTASEPSSEYLNAANTGSAERRREEWTMEEAIARNTVQGTTRGLETWQAQDFENPPIERNPIRRYPSTSANFSFRKVEPSSVWGPRKKEVAELVKSREAAASTSRAYNVLLAGEYYGEAHGHLFQR